MVENFQKVDAFAQANKRLNEAFAHDTKVEAELMRFYANTQSKEAFVQALVLRLCVAEALLKQKP